MKNFILIKFIREVITLLLSLIFRISNLIFKALGFIKSSSAGTNSSKDSDHVDVVERLGLPAEVKQMGFTEQEIVNITWTMQKTGMAKDVKNKSVWKKIEKDGANKALKEQSLDYLGIPPGAADKAPLDVLVESAIVIQQLGGDSSDPNWWDDFDVTMRESQDIPIGVLPGASVSELLKHKGIIQKVGGDTMDKEIWDDLVFMDKEDFLNKHLGGTPGPSSGGSNTGVTPGPGRGQPSSTSTGTTSPDSTTGGGTRDPGGHSSGSTSGSSSSGSSGSSNDTGTSGGSGSGSGSNNNPDSSSGESGSNNTPSDSSTPSDSTGGPQGTGDAGSSNGSVTKVTFTPDGQGGFTAEFVKYDKDGNVVYAASAHYTDADGDGTYEADSGEEGVTITPEDGKVPEGTYTVSDNEDTGESEYGRNEGNGGNNNDDNDNNDNSDNDNDDSDDDDDDSDNDDDDNVDDSTPVDPGHDHQVSSMTLTDLIRHVMTVNGIAKSIAVVVQPGDREDGASSGSGNINNPASGWTDPTDDDRSEGSRPGSGHINNPQGGIIDYSEENSGFSTGEGGNLSSGVPSLATIGPGQNDVWRCRRQMVEDADGVLWCYCPVAVNPQTGEPVDQWIEVRLTAPGHEYGLEAGVTDDAAGRSALNPDTEESDPCY